MKNNKPRYEHDCDTCVFLGRHGKYDLYVCPRKNIHEGTVIARWSSDGPDYTSGICFRYAIKPLGVAFDLAVKRGLLTEEHYQAQKGVATYMFNKETGQYEEVK